MTLTTTSNAQGYAVRRHDDAVLRGAVGAEDDGARVVHNSTATKNTSLQSVRDMMVIAMPWNAPLKRSALNIEAGHVSNLPPPNHIGYDTDYTVGWVISSHPSSSPYSS